MASRSQFQFWKSSNSTWVTAEHNNFNAVIGFTINDALDNPKFLQLTLNNSPNDPFGSTSDAQKGPFAIGADNELKEFQRCRVIETDTGNILFYGKIYRLTDEFDLKYGQLLRIIAYDNLQELADYPTLDKETGIYAKNKKRSTIIKNIINSTQPDSLRIPTSNILTTTGSAHFINSSAYDMFEDSARTFPNDESSGRIYLNTGKNRGLSAILEIAKVDPHQASGEEKTFGYDYYLSERFTSLGNYTPPAQQFNYFKRGSRPAAVESNKTNFKGLRIEYPTASFAETGLHRVMLTDYSFDRAAEEVYTHGIINTTEEIASYDASTGKSTTTEQRKHLKCELLAVNFGSSNSAFQWSGKAFDASQKPAMLSTDVAEIVRVQISGTWYPIGRIQYQSGTVNDGHIIISYEEGEGHEDNINTHLAASNTSTLTITGATTGAECTIVPSTGRLSNAQTVVRPLNLPGQGIDQTDGLRRKLAAALMKSKEISIKGSMRMLQTPYRYVDTTISSVNGASQITLNQINSADIDEYGFKLGMTIAKIDSDGDVTAYGYAQIITDNTVTATLNTGNWTGYSGSVRLYMPIRAGHYIHATNRLQNVNGYHFVNEVVYSEGEAVAATQFNTLSTQASDNTTIGIGLAPGAVTANIENRTAPIGAIRDNFAIAALPWTLIPDTGNTTNVMYSSDYDTITVASSILSLGNGMYQYDISGHTIDVTANHTIIYFDKDVSTTQFQSALKQSYVPASNHVVIGWAKAVSNVDSNSRAILHIGTGAVGADGTMALTDGSTISQVNTAQVANDSVTAAHLKPSARPWTTNIEFKGTAWNAIKWFKGQNNDGSAVGNETTDATLEFANGDTLTLTAEASNSHATGMSAGTTYYMIISGTMTNGSTKPVTRTTNYTDALADTTILLAIITTGVAYTNDSNPGSGQSPNILPFNSKSPTINAIAIASDSITVDALQAGSITADEIAAGSITSDRIHTNGITGDKINITGETTWTGVQSSTAAYNLANSANSLAGTKNETFRQASTPSAVTIGDIWLDTDDNKIYIAQGTGTGSGTPPNNVWVLRDDAGAINNATTNINGGLINTQSIILTSGGSSNILQTGSGTGSGTRVVLSNSGIYGWNSTTAQFILSAADGKASAGGGTVVLDSGGAKIASTSSSDGNSISGYFGFYYGNNISNALSSDMVWGIRSTGASSMTMTKGHSNDVLFNMNQTDFNNMGAINGSTSDRYFKLPINTPSVGEVLTVASGSGTVSSPWLTEWDAATAATTVDYGTYTGNGYTSSGLSISTNVSTIKAVFIWKAPSSWNDSTSSTRSTSGAGYYVSMETFGDYGGEGHMAVYYPYNNVFYGGRINYTGNTFKVYSSGTYYSSSSHNLNISGQKYYWTVIGD